MHVAAVSKVWGPRSLVYAPLAILSLLFVGFAFLLSASSQLATLPFWSITLSGAAIYAAAVALLLRFGLSHVSRLESLGLTDTLCLLPNRRALHIDAERKADLGQELAVALIDLDGFKLINDHYGHVTGDELLRVCADILRDVCGAEAHCYRLGGDEFAITMSGPLAGTILEGICRALLERLTKPIMIESRRLAIGASIGLARSTGADGYGSSELLRQADVAMYASKRGGKMRCTWYTREFDRNREAVQQIDGELRKALASEDFHLLYQPLVGARSGRVVAVEALLRWNRAEGKPMEPGVFIPIAEESGLINAIGLWVLRKACTDALAWPGIKLSVNISAAQLRDVGFPVQLGQILEETGFPPERLELEITETCLVIDPVLAERSLDLIRGFGVNVALDDFGTGYASIGFLRQFRFEKLKLDRSLVAQAGEDDGCRAMMLSSITVARALKMDVTAEGVETEAQAAMARAAGCDQIQGWLYFTPLPAGDIAQHLEKPAMPNPQRRVAIA